MPATSRHLEGDWPRRLESFNPAVFHRQFHFERHPVRPHNLDPRRTRPGGSGILPLRVLHERETRPPRIEFRPALYGAGWPGRLTTIDSGMRGLFSARDLFNGFRLAFFFGQLGPALWQVAEPPGGKRTVNRLSTESMVPEIDGSGLKLPDLSYQEAEPSYGHEDPRRSARESVGDGDRQPMERHDLPKVSFSLQVHVCAVGLKAADLDGGGSTFQERHGHGGQHRSMAWGSGSCSTALRGAWKASVGTSGGRYASRRFP